jgi:hypothetical protein
MSLSQKAMARCIELAISAEKTLKSKASNFQYYSLAFDENTDVTDTAQLSIFVRGVEKILMFLKKWLP